jgi:multicomponent K+:H+ antiporter subunit G
VTGALTGLPAWAALTTALLVLLGAGLALTGSLGLLRLGSFYERVHAPTLGTTLGAGGILIASMICFSALQTRPVLHEILIAVFVTMTTPVTLMLLVRAALYRDRAEGSDKVPGVDHRRDGSARARAAPSPRPRRKP